MNQHAPSPPTVTGLRIRWDSPDVLRRGEIDVFSPQEFALECPGECREHEVRLGKKHFGYALFRLKVDGSMATLDYAIDRAANKARGMLPGVLRLGFTDATRTTIKSASWTPYGRKTEEPLEFQPVKETPDELGPYQGPGRPDKRFREQMVQARDGQLAFRRQVLDTYGGTCSISGCRIAITLEAAHIDPFNGPRTHHPCNGLLLRADLHRLFDGRLLAVHPEDGTVWIHPSLLGHAEYASLAGRRITAPAAARKPDTDALARRWAKRLPEGFSPQV